MVLLEHVLLLNNKLWLCFDIVTFVEIQYWLIKTLHILEPFPHLLLEQECKFILRGNMPQHVQFAMKTEYTVSKCFRPHVIPILYYFLFLWNPKEDSLKNVSKSIESKLNSD